MRQEKLFFSLFASSTIACSLSSYSLSAPVPEAPPSGVLDKNSSEISGVVAQYLINPHGDIDGFLLEGGKQLHFPPHLSNQVSKAFKPGDRIIARGVQRANVIFVVQELLNTQSKTRIVDSGPPKNGPKPPPLAPPPLPFTAKPASPPAPPPPPKGNAALLTRGTVKTSLYGPLGDVNGFLLSDGTIVKLPPETAFNLSSVITPGQLITVEGTGSKSAFGTCIEAAAIGIGNQPRISIYGR